jgi:hypothetical protein
MSSVAEKKRKALFIKGFHDAEKLIRIAKSEASKMGLRGKIIVLELGHYNPTLNGQAVIVEEAGREYNAPSGGSIDLEDKWKSKNFV